MTFDLSFTDNTYLPIVAKDCGHFLWNMCPYTISIRNAKHKFSCYLVLMGSYGFSMYILEIGCVGSIIRFVGWDC